MAEMSVIEPAVVEAIGEGGFVVTGREYETLIVPQLDISLKWQELQNNSLSEYQKTHVEEIIDPGIHAYYRLFRGYAAAASPKERARVLDIGCGISQELPIYARNMKAHWEYFGLDPFQVNLKRNYPFLCGTLEATSERLQFSERFDLFLFCTSLDHFENLQDCAKAVQKLAAPGARCVFWLGLHDPELVAAPEGAAVFRRAFRTHPLFAIPIYLGYGLLRFPKTVYNMWRRRRMLKRAEPLDDLHFWYFVKNEFESCLQNFGIVEDVISIPGTNYIFATCLIDA